MKIFHTLSLVLLIAVIFCGVVQADIPVKARLVELTKVWDEAPHNAFPGLIRYDNAFYIALREGASHASVDGKIRILRSMDGKTWEQNALLFLDSHDLRDAQLAETPDGRLMVLGGVATRDVGGESAPTGTFVAFSEDGLTWGDPEIVIDPGRWMWRLTWHDGKAYGISYSAFEGAPYLYLHGSYDGREWWNCDPLFHDAGSEAVIRFDDNDNAYALVRSNLFGKSEPPYDEWTWTTFTSIESIGGPDFIKTSKGWIAAGRRVDSEGSHTTVFHLDVDEPRLTRLLTLPSGGDNGYSSLVWYDGYLWMVYYSTHEGAPTSIYFAKIELLDPVRPVMYETKGQEDPLTNNFILNPSPRGSYTIGPANDGEDHWGIQTAERFAYSAPLDPTFMDEPNGPGWTATWRSRTINNGAYDHVTDYYTYVRDGFYRWEVMCLPHLVAGNDPGFYALFSGLGWLQLDTSDPVDVTQYHTYQIVYDPAGDSGNGSAVYAVDGKIYTDPPVATDELYTLPGYYFFTFGDQGGVNNGMVDLRFAHARFERGQHLLKFSVSELPELSRPGSAVHTIQMYGEPVGDVDFTIVTDDQLKVDGLDQKTLTFNTSTTQDTVTISTVADPCVAELSGVLTYETASTDADYNNLELPMQIVEIAASAPATPYVVLSKRISEIAEDGSDWYYMELGYEPTSTVTVSFETGSLLQPIADIQFDSNNWDDAQQVFINPVAGGVGPGHAVQIIEHSVSSGDARYNGVDVDEVGVLILDNDDFCGKNREAFSAEDINRDCSTDLYDFIYLMGQWMSCSFPGEEACPTPCLQQ